MQAKTPVSGLRLGLLSLVISQLFGGSALAGTDAERIAELEKKLANSISQIERLANRISELEKGAPAAGASATGSTSVGASTNAATSPALVDSRVEALERTVSQITEASARAPASQGLPLHGFADVGYASSSKNAADNRKRGFVLGNISFYLSPEFGDHVKSLIELNFEYGDEGGLATDLERLQIGYTFSDQATLWAGRFHTPYGIWNTGFHHGAQIQTSILRPKLVAFEDQGGILPAHTVGLWATGIIKAGQGKFEYDAYVGNGSRILDGVLDFNAIRDDNGNKLVGGSVRYRFGDALSGLTLGLHGYKQQVGSYAGNVLQSRSRVNMLGAYGLYEENDWEVISEYYRFHNRNLDGLVGSHSSWAGFFQIGRTFNSEYTPYIRLEKASLNQNDNYFARLDSGRSYTRSVLGLRLDVNPRAAFKIEFNSTDEGRDGGQKYREAQLQYAIRF